MTGRDPYAVLGLASGASMDEARAAYHRLVEIYHPDRFQGRDPALVAEATGRLEEVIAAWATLRGEPAVVAEAPEDDVADVAAATEPVDLTDDGSGGAIFDAEIQAL